MIALIKNVRIIDIMESIVPTKTVDNCNKEVSLTLKIREWN